MTETAAPINTDDPASYELRVKRVTPETEHAHSLTFEVPEELQETFRYKPGQFLTLAIPSDQTVVAARCYSLSSSPLGEPGEVTVTVKRTEDGYASNWICDHLNEGASIRMLPPSGIFTPKDLDAELLLFAGGSGVTPIMSIIRTALKQGSGRITVVYANRDERSVIFASELSELAAAHPDRLQVTHWLESVQGLPTQEQIRAIAADHLEADAFVCGPPPFMKITTAALKELEFPRERRHQEKFVSLGGNPFGEVVKAPAVVSDIGDGERTSMTSLEIELDGETHTFSDWPNNQTLLEFLESKGVKAPYSCRAGECSACAIRLTEGEVVMRHNDVLDEEDLDDGIRLGCQSEPTTEVVKGSYS